jgi:hypothetical protein
MDERPDQIDKMVFTETQQIRRLHAEACKRLGLAQRKMTPVTLMQRSVR